MDTHDITRDRGTVQEVLNQVEIPIQVIGIDSDLLYPTSEQKELAHFLPNGRYHVIHSHYGHDAFLIEFDQLNNIVKPFIDIQKILAY